MIIDLIDTAVKSGVRLQKAGDTIGLSARTIIRWRQRHSKSRPTQGSFDNTDEQVQRARKATDTGHIQ